MSSTALKEKTVRPRNGFAMLFVNLALVASGVALLAVTGATENPLFLLPGIPCALAGLVCLFGHCIVNPNTAKVMLFFGEYRGTIRRPGFYWVNPFMVKRAVSLRVHNFTVDTLKVNDELGNPIEIAAVVVWKVQDTAKATLEVEDHLSYVTVQSEAALRHLASTHPYDTNDSDSTSLRGSAPIVNRELLEELSERLQLAGIEVLEARLSHLAYAPEIAGAMLQRQQAEAIIAARTRIVDGAVGMVQMALEKLSERDVVHLDEEKKANMVSSLLVVLCSERGTQPVLSTGATN